MRTIGAIGRVVAEALFWAVSWVLAITVVLAVVVPAVGAFVWLIFAAGIVK